MASVFDRVSLTRDRLAHAWNAFVNTQDTDTVRMGFGGSVVATANPGRNRISTAGDKTIMSSIYTRISIDFASVEMNHVYLDDNKRYLKDAASGLNNCLTVQANIDQGGRQFRQDMCMTLLDKGYIAIIPVDTSDNPLPSGTYDIFTLRIGEIISWYPRNVRVRAYNDITGKKEDITLPKSVVAIVENPLYAVMNEPNSTYQRLLRKLSLLDAVDEAASSGKLDIIIQLPYVVKNQTKQEQAEQRARDIEQQLKGSKYGVAYTDGTERITQLNRPAENNMLAQVQYLTTQLYSQLGLAPSVFDGTADEKTLLNYYNRTIEPLLGAVAEAMKRSFLTKTARTQGQSIEFYRDPFKLLAISDLAELADKLTRNEILTSNEFRALMGYKPSKDPQADKLLNKNLPLQSQQAVNAESALSKTPRVDLGELQQVPNAPTPAPNQQKALTSAPTQPPSTRKE